MVIGIDHKPIEVVGPYRPFDLTVNYNKRILCFGVDLRRGFVTVGISVDGKSNGVFGLFDWSG